MYVICCQSVNIQIMMYVHNVILYVSCECVRSSVQVRLGKLLGNAGTWEGKLNVQSVGLGTVTPDSSVMVQPRVAELTILVC